MYFKILAILASIVILSHAKSYENYKVYSVVPSSDVQVNLLNALRENGYEIWNDFVTIGSDVRVMVAPERQEEFDAYTRSVGISPVLSISNVQELINDQLKPAQNVQRETLGSFSWTSYHTLAEIHAWLDELQQMYPDVVEVVTIGNSIEGRPIKGVVIDLKSGQREGTPLIGMIEGGIHAREWISPATVTWIIKEFLTSTDSEVKFMAEAFVWHIFPVVNPDGYVYTFSNDRMWRKNRNPASFTNCTGGNDISNGVDLNRNFNFLWMTVGASNNPCAQTYAGVSGSSELEAQAITNYVLQLKTRGNFIYYFAFHSYSQMVLIPYSHATGLGVLEAENYADLYEIAARGADKLHAKHGIQYTFGTSAEILYEVSGSSFDWVKGVADIPIVYLFELRDVGEYGFLLPTEQIIPNNEEIMACLVEMDISTRNLGYYSYSGAATMFAGVLSLVIGFLMVLA